MKKWVDKFKNLIYDKRFKITSAFVVAVGLIILMEINVTTYTSNIIDEYNSLVEDYNTLYDEYDKIYEQYTNLNNERIYYTNQQTTIDNLKKERKELKSQNQTMEEENEYLRSQIQELQKQVNSSQSNGGGRLITGSEGGNGFRLPSGGGSSQTSATVYWTSEGEVYHSTPDCSALSRSSNVFSGTIEQSGKGRACKICY